METLRGMGFAVAARYNTDTSQIIVDVDTGVQIAFPKTLFPEIATADPDGLAYIDISPAGLGLHWPKLDVDVYIPALLQGIFDAKKSAAA